MLSKERRSGKRQLKDFKTGELILVLRAYSFRLHLVQQERVKQLESRTIIFFLNRKWISRFSFSFAEAGSKLNTYHSLIEFVMSFSIPFHASMGCMIKCGSCNCRIAMLGDWNQYFVRKISVIFFLYYIILVILMLWITQLLNLLLCQESGALKRDALIIYQNLPNLWSKLWFYLGFGSEFCSCT
jgi:hypothetical protein